MFHDEDIGANQSTERRFQTIVTARLSRRALLRGGTAGAAIGVFGNALIGTVAAAQAQTSFGFTDIPAGPQPDLAVAAGYRAQVLIRWGDKVAARSPAFDVRQQSAAAQAQQFGYNNDFLAFMPLPQGSRTADHGILWVNHEYSESHMMFPGLNPRTAAENVTREQVDAELAAHGGSVIEVRKSGSTWQVVEDSRYARRITLNTEMKVAGPAAGHARLRTKADPTGMSISGMINNCGGGTTPWGTVLTAEENFNLYFTGDATKTAEAASLKRYGFATSSRYGFSRFHDRFNVEKEPNEGNRFGWVVEIDPYDPTSTPIKRTALGRFKHEAATTWINPNGTVTVYSGDDEANEYVYKFVTAGRFNPADRAANRNLLDNGTLYVAQFSDDGTVKWLPLVHGQGPLTAANGFNSQADVVIEARRAADLLKATPMDRPEAVDTSPVTGRTYIALTNNSRRKPEEVNKANPRPANEYGQVVELIPPGVGKEADHTSLEHRWDMLLVAGPVDKGGRYGATGPATGFVACPDYMAFDNKGRLWLATDQGTAQSKFGVGDGIWAVDVTGPGRAIPKFFFRTPTGAEMCGPCFTPDSRTLFLAVQHPAADDPGSTFDKPSTRWPDFKDDMPPRPSVVAITRADGGEIGS